MELNATKSKAGFHTSQYIARCANLKRGTARAARHGVSQSNRGGENDLPNMWMPFYRVDRRSKSALLPAMPFQINNEINNGAIFLISSFA